MTKKVISGSTLFLFVGVLLLYSFSVWAETSDPSSVPRGAETTSASTPEAGTLQAEETQLGSQVLPETVPERATTSATEPITPRGGMPLPLPPSPATVESESQVPAPVSTSTESSNSNVFLIAVVAILGALGLLGVFQLLRSQKNKNQKDDPCREIKNQLLAKKSELSGAKGALSIQEELVEALKKKAEEKLKEKAKDALLETEKSGSLKKAVKTAEDLSAKLEQAQKLLETLQAKHSLLEKEVQTLESSYKACVVSASNLNTVFGLGEKVDLPTSHPLQAIIVPGNGNDMPEDRWRPWVTKELEKFGISTTNIRFPDPVHARSVYWLPYLEELKADENTILIGHSSGAIAAMRYAEKHKILGSVLIGVYHTDLNDESEKQDRKSVV